MYILASLDSNNITYSLFTAGEGTIIVKDFNEAWDILSKAKAYEALDFNGSASNLADSIFQACIHCTSGLPSKVEKTIYIITDGYPSAPEKLKMSLAYAESLGVQIIAIGVGYFTEGISEYFSNYIVANNPKDIPIALQHFYCGTTTPDTFQDALKKEVLRSIDGKSMSLTDAWNTVFQDVYKDQVDRTRKAIYFAMAPARNSCNIFRVDLCFVLDTTGSMGGMIKMAKDKISSITKSISSCVKESSDREAKMRLGFVGYKIAGQENNLDNIPFTEDKEYLLELVKKQTAIGGSWGGVEDKYEALEMAIGFNWTGLVKFLVLIADAPGHGLWCTGEEYRRNDNYPERANDMPGLVARIARERIYLFYVDISTFTDYERDNFEKEYNKHAPDDMKGNGFKILKINDGNDGERLAKMISGTVATIIVSEFM